MDTNQPQLDDASRTQLDGIVQQMVTNKEPDTNIQAVVDDFKQKYSKPITQVTQQTSPQPSFLQKTTNVVNSIFPGKQLGKALGNSIFAIGQTVKGAFQKLTGNSTGASQSFANAGEAADENNTNYNKIAADTGGIALAGATSLVGGATPLARVAGQAALGTGIGATNAIANGSTDVKDIATKAAVGGVTGGVLSGAGEGLSALTENLPKWFVQKALPKLDPKNVDYALQNLDAGTVASNLEKSSQAVKASSNTINSLLSHPQYESEVGNIEKIINDTISKYPNAQLNENKIGSIVKQVAPAQKDLVDKVINGTANLAEQNSLRQTLDQAVYPKFTDTPSLTFTKQIAKAFGDSLRTNVKTTAPETQFLFNELSKEIPLRTALTAAKLKIAKGSPVSLYDIMAGVGGGIPGVIGEKVARTPAALITAAKGLNYLNKAKPLVSGAVNALRAPLLKGATQVLGK